MFDITKLNFLVTGGAGFIGSNIVQYLVDNNAKYIKIIDNLSTGKIDNIKPFLNNSNLEFVYGDITNYAFCLNVTCNIDIICHQAALVSVNKSINEPLDFHNTNVTGFINILEAARNNNIKRIVYASSSSVYGNDKQIQKKENIIGNQLSPYGVTKYIDELYANIYTKLYNMQCIGLRYFNVFGPKQNLNGQYAAVIPTFIDNIVRNIQPIIYGDGSNTRDFTFVKNIVLANIQAMLTNNELCFGQVFNIGCGSSISILKLFKIINKKLNKNIKPIFHKQRIGDIKDSLADISKAKYLLNYKPVIDLNDGLDIILQ